MKTTGPATESHARHMGNLKGMSTAEQRREYIDGVRRTEGNFYAKWLLDDFGAWWQASSEQRKAKA